MREAGGQDGKKSLVHRASDCKKRALRLGFRPYPTELQHWLSTIGQLASLVYELSKRVEGLTGVEAGKRDADR